MSSRSSSELVALAPDDVVSLTDRPTGDVQTMPVETVRWQMRRIFPPVSRRIFLRGLVATAAGAGLAALGIFPAGREALAHCGTEGVQHRDMRSTCPSGQGDTDCLGCCCSTAYSDACDGTWHKTSGSYRNRFGDCDPNNSVYDGWYWKLSGCAICGSLDTRWKCHDGCKNVSGTWKYSICKTYSCVPV